jgi:hypothetical protein
MNFRNIEEVRYGCLVRAVEHTSEVCLEGGLESTKE